MSRPQIGIDRLPANRRLSNEPKQAMNCKSCRKRKIKCNRVKPTCEACTVFSCACIYDAVPKKRGPKTDVLEALLKRVNGLERRLQDEKTSPLSEHDSSPDPSKAAGTEPKTFQEPEASSRKAHRELTAIPSLPPPLAERPEQRSTPNPLPAHPMEKQSTGLISVDTILNIFFSRLHTKPYYILDEAATRQRLRDRLLPRFLVSAIYAVTVRYASHLCGGHNAAVRFSQEYALQARAEIDVDESSIDHLQALLLLAITAFQSGRGKKNYMLLSHAISMAFALSLHRELPSQLRIAQSEREGRRRLFWTCFLMDRFTVAGSRRPALILDESICLRMPGWLPTGSQICVDGNYFPTGLSLPHAAGMSNSGQSSDAMLVDIVRILGATNRYLAGGGVKGDSHFPWHAQSKLSRIRSDLDYWVANTQDTFRSAESLFNQPDTTILVLSKLIYHLVHCLLYRPFLPIDLTELAGSGQDQSWQIEATGLCFLHANAITELVEIGKSSFSIIEWPSFVGYCVCTAGTIHVHGAHYFSMRDGDVFANSADSLSKEMTQLCDLRYTWSGIQHQRETLQVVYTSHCQLVKSLATNPMRFSPVFQMEDFFDRYPGSYIDGAHVTFSDVEVEIVREGFPALKRGSDHEDENERPAVVMPTQFQNQMTPQMGIRQPSKRRTLTNGHLPLPYPTPASVSEAADLAQQHTTSTLQDDYLLHSHTSSHTQMDLDAHHQPHVPPQSGGLSPNSNFSPMTRIIALPQQATHAQSPSEDISNNNQTFTQSGLSPSFNYSPMHQTLASHTEEYYQQHHHNDSLVYDDNHANRNDSPHATNPEQDPFLSLLEQLAQQSDGDRKDGRIVEDFGAAGGLFGRKEG